MSPALAAATALALVFAGFACLALAMDRHHEQATGLDTPALRRALLRLNALALGAAALAVCLQSWGSVVAILVWLGLLSCGAILVTLTLSYLPRRLPLIALAAAMAALALLGR
ncbi:DUF3325 domain-containing protein [Bordetella genomosp. 12]|uniref:DUF3325 domain-containing protein n=1 Tax=Bordetella genomosp. 12 TaxID=463035 RepID=A0A261VBK6_9BORD|nr:DUF3325 domain-containing protein [Bordetella genomosp. 12]OZI71548.1 hypothetical protein CAL22_17190 [Bordetella genomosp. 12]